MKQKEELLKNSEKATTNKTYNVYRKRWVELFVGEMTKETFTDENVSLFLSSIWDSTHSKPQVKGARSMLHSMLIQNSLETLETQHLYPKTFLIWKALKNDPLWIGYEKKQAVVFLPGKQYELVSKLGGWQEAEGENLLNLVVFYLLCRLRFSDAMMLTASRANMFGFWKWMEGRKSSLIGQRSARRTTR
jgi:hypothetical protein